LIVSAQKELTEPRIPNMRGIMAARSKPLKVVEATDAEKTSVTLSFDLPPAKGGVKLISPEDAASLIGILHNDIKII
jgi:electron transfer flavoprotein beta subunit